MSSEALALDLGRYKLGWSDEEDYVFKPKRGLNTDIVQEMSWMKSEPGLDAELPLEVALPIREAAHAQLGRRHVGH